MARTYELTWIDKNAHVGPLFRINRDVYSRDRAGSRVIRLKAVESYTPAGVAPAVEAFTECARTWGAPVVFIIDPDLKKPPAGRFLFEWSRTTAANGSVERCFMRTTNRLTRLMGALVLRLFTDGAMPFEAIRGDEALEKRLDALDLACPQPGFRLTDPSTALVLHRDAPQTLLGSLFSRMVRRATGGGSSRRS